MQTNSDFSDLLRAFNDEKVRYLVVGAHAVTHHAEPRFTRDLDVWVEPTTGNAARVWRALGKFGAPLDDVTTDDFANPDLVYQIGVDPHRVDVLMGIDGVTFSTAWRNRVRSTYGAVPILVIGRTDLIRNKRAAGRPQDLLDVDRLNSAALRSNRRRRK